MHHLLTYNGIPIEDLEDLKSAIAGDLLDPSTLTELSAKLHTARYEELPEGFIELWTEREPVVMGLIEFRPAPAPASVMPMLPAPTSTLAASVNRAAALGLLSGEIGDHFLFTEENNVIINPTNPPSLEQAYEITRRALEIKEAGSRLDNFACWTLGAIVDQCERFFGDRFDITTVCEATAKSYNVVVTALGVFRAFGAQRRALSFTHHKEVYYADMPDEAKYWVLDQSEKLELTCAQNRDLVRYVRKHGFDGISADDLADTHRLMDKCKAQGRTKIWLFQLRDEWFEYRGSFEDIPNGADPIINGESRAPVDRQGRIVRPKEWALPGEPLRGNQAVKEAAVVKAREAAQAVEEPAEPEAAIEVETESVTGESTEEAAVEDAQPEAESVVSTQPEGMPEYLARAEPAELF